MPNYLVLIAYEPSNWDNASEEVRAAFYTDHEAFSAYVARHGTEHASAALAGTGEARTLRHAGGVRDGMVSVTEGPFAETAEMIGGYYEIELPDLDHALTAAALLPPSYSVEVRPTIRIE